LLTEQNHDRLSSIQTANMSAGLTEPTLIPVSSFRSNFG